MRIFDNPNHPQYGPVRRLWVMLAQLDLLDVADRLNRDPARAWDTALAQMVSLDVSEKDAQRAILHLVLDNLLVPTKRR